MYISSTVILDVVHQTALYGEGYWIGDGSIICL